MAQISGSFNKWTDDIRPINLTTTNLVNNTTCIVSGWGTTLDVRQLFYFLPKFNISFDRR
jgi:DNA mismatch repair ATPase MutL